MPKNVDAGKDFALTVKFPPQAKFEPVNFQLLLFIFLIDDNSL